MNKTYTFFWNGPFSQWYNSNFIMDNIQFNTAEQYMMYHKAMLFDDVDSAKKILATRDPKTQKALGRTVQNFNMSIWNDNCVQIVFRGNHAKFNQNKHLYNILMKTGTTDLVEASPYDKIWGIGLNEDDAKKTNPDSWPGSNWLGIILTDLREHFKEEERIEREYKNGRS